RLGGSGGGARDGSGRRCAVGGRRGGRRRGGSRLGDGLGDLRLATLLRLGRDGVGGSGGGGRSGGGCLGRGRCLGGGGCRGRVRGGRRAVRGGCSRIRFTHDRDHG